MWRAVFVFTLLLAGIGAAHSASPSSPQNGDYVRIGGTGELRVRGSTFEIESTGRNCHECSLGGQISSSVGVATGASLDDANASCKIAFTKSTLGFDVGPITPDACRSYCGALGNFDGNYRIPSDNCVEQARRHEREAASRLESNGNNRKAISMLQSQISSCHVYMNWIELDDVRNAIAMLQFRRGQPADCRRTLSATVAAKYNEVSLKAEMPPCDFDNYILVARATWGNKQRCEMKKDSQRDAVGSNPTFQRTAAPPLN